MGGESSRRKKLGIPPRGTVGHVVEVQLPATFVVEPVTHHVYFPRPGKASQRVTDQRVIDIVMAEFNKDAS
jgi:hypothetical protein